MVVRAPHASPNQPGPPPPSSTGIYHSFRGLGHLGPAARRHHQTNAGWKTKGKTTRRRAERSISEPPRQASTHAMQANKAASVLRFHQVCREMNKTPRAASHALRLGAKAARDVEASWNSEDRGRTRGKHFSFFLINKRRHNNHITI